MKRRDLESELLRLGWAFLRAGGKHDVWGRGKETLAIPRHSEINELLAKSLIKRARKPPAS